MARPFPPDWLAILDRRVPYYRNLPEDRQRELHGLIQVLIAEKRFEGAGGLELTDEIRVTIAAQAAILLLGRRTNLFPKLFSIVVYPREYAAPAERDLPGGAVAEEPETRFGESWGVGTIVLSWEDVLRGARDPRDGHNVVFHEFAHSLDDEAGVADGAPPLADAAQSAEWQRVMDAAYRSLVDASEHRRRTFLDPYGADSPAEFFAVVTEYFFETPRELRGRYREMYGMLRGYFQVDPAEWL